MQKHFLHISRDIDRIVTYETEKKTQQVNLPTAGDIDRDPEEPVGDGLGLMPWELGVPGAAEAPPVPPPLELSLLFWPVESWDGEKK